MQGYVYNAQEDYQSGSRCTPVCISFWKQATGLEVLIGP